MNKLGLLFLFICCGIVMVFGNQHWNEQIEEAASAKESSHEENKTEKPSSHPVSLAGNWSEQSRENFASHVNEETPFVISIVGTEMMDHSSFSIFDHVSSAVSEAYGSAISLEKYIYEGTSMEFVNEDTAEEVNSANPDMILLEPASLADNGEVRAEDAVENLQTIIEAFEDHNPDVSVILIDPLPLYGAVYYPNEVDEIREYAEANDIPYIHHWDKWKMDEGTEMEKYLSEDQRTPNEEGFTLMLKKIEDYLIAS